MRAEAMSFYFLANEAVVQIPFFQRGYVWSKPNWEELLINLLDDKKNHFLGSLILKQLQPMTGRPREVLVIDGQQRLTTLSILTRVIFDLFTEDVQANCEGAMQACLFYKRLVTDNELNVKIRHSRVDSNSYVRVIKGQALSDINTIDDKCNGILKCYKYFHEELSKHNPEVKIGLFNRLLNNENKILVLVDLTEKEDEQAIFDTINSTGVRLSGADIIKNALFQRALELPQDHSNNEDQTNAEVINLYTDCWDNVFSKDEETITFWSTPRQTGRLMRDNIEILLHSILVINGIFDPEKHTLSNLSSLYKEHIKGLNKNDLFAFASLIKEYATIYREKIASFERSSLFTYSDSRSRLLHILEVCEISTFHPYLLFLLKEYGSNEDKLNEKLLELEKLVIRRLISKAETKNYNKMCKDLIKNDCLAKTMLNEILDEQILTGLTNINNKYAALILFWVELKRRNTDNMQSVKELKYNYSLEHIMPQKWEEHWSSVPYVDEAGEPLDDPDAAKNKRYSYVYHIGNMTLLNSSLNTSLRNYVFDHKMNGEGKKKGIKDYADLSITRDDIVKPYEDGDVVWNERKIFIRTASLHKEIVCIW
uniref:DUF262 domain-containing protein n=1 Tax=Candidatus Nitrotoga fabula TaxID=2182327 RepID=A0A2X0QVY1_9PROT|nr:conserved protein of unknown function [Candidatus Nitrotoga fabula]